MMLRNITRALTVIGMFIGGVALCVCVCLFLIARTPLLSCGQTLPDDLDARQYLLDGFRADENGSYVFSFEAGADVPSLVLTITDASPFSLSFNGEACFQYASNDAYRRNIVIPIGVPAAGDNRLTLEMRVWGSGDGELLLGYSSVPKVLIGSGASASEAAAFYRQMGTLSTGLYLMMIFSSLTLYLRRRRERYLLALVFVALASMLVMLLDSYVPVFHISQNQYASIRSPLFICPAIFTAAIGFYLFYDELPERARPFLTFRLLMISTLLIVIVQYLISYNLNFVLRLALMVPLLALFASAEVHRKPGARLMAIGCGVAEGARVVVYMVNPLNLIPAGEVLIYLRVTQLGYLVYLMLCMVVIYARFADKFTEAETLVKTLDAMVDERTAQLQEAYRRLEQAQAREHETMTAVLHDLRTPIFHIQGCLDMLKVEDPSNQEVLLLIRERTEYLKSLAENLFLAAKLEDGRITINCHEVNLPVLCRYLSDNAKIGAQAKRIDFVQQIAPVAPLFSDGFRIRQVLENLLDNAVKYTPEGGRILFSLESEQDCARIRVENSGKGIPPENLPKVFDRFYHGANSGSSGLGLYIARTLAEMLGGTIDAKSADGITCFTVRIPKGGEEEDPKE